MVLDKQAVLEAQRRYREMNEADLIHRVRTAGQKTPADRWLEFRDLMAFCRAVRPEPSEWEHRKHVADWNAYYDTLRRFEEARARRAEGLAARAA